MTKSRRHPIRALLVSTAVVPLGYWLAMVAEATAHGVRFGVVRALRELMIISAFGGPTALAMAVLWGAPIVYVLIRMGALRMTTVVVAGAAGGALVSLLFAEIQRGGLFRVRMPLPLAIALGALAGGAWWLAGGARVVRGDARGASGRASSPAEE
ncbi:MAG: hypothetical protein HY824_01885 [Acidobacteria bacterium]|nr:hypothetical protein [Acidobacteriota bacterium]